MTAGPMLSQVEVDGLRIGYRRAGAGPPLVLLHGGLSDSRDWTGQLDSALCDSFDLVAWDAPGCGGSDDPPYGWTASDYGDALAGFVAALDLGRPHVLGLSWGAVLALELWRGHPDVPASLVLVSTYAGWAGSLPAAEVRRRVEGVLRDLDRPLSEVAADWAPTLLSPAATPAMVAASVTGLADVHPDGTRVMLEAFAWADYGEVPATITVPTLFLHGAADTRAPLDPVRAMQQAVPDGQLVVLPGAGHLVNVEVPELFEAAVLEFLA
jgi:pimeloyl-ACP methyl ester carboxylesterase